MFNDLDGFQIDRFFQPAANRFQVFAGMNCFFLARICFIAMLPLHFIQYALESSLFDMADLILTAMVSAISFGDTIVKEHQTLNGRITMNAARINPLAILLRIIASSALIVFGVADLVIWLFGSSGSLTIHKILLSSRMAFFWAGVYFEACTPLPYQKSWLKRLVEGIKPTLQGVAVPTPEPIVVGSQ